MSNLQKRDLDYIIWNWRFTPPEADDASIEVIQGNVKNTVTFVNFAIRMGAIYELAPILADIRIRVYSRLRIILAHSRQTLFLESVPRRILIARQMVQHSRLSGPGWD
jgi:hypothetical protein